MQVYVINFFYVFRKFLLVSLWPTMCLEHATRDETDVCRPKQDLLMLSGESLLDEHIAYRRISHKFYLSDDRFVQYLYSCTDFYLIAYCVEASGISWRLLTSLLTPCNRVLLEKLTGSAASQEILHIFGTLRFITVLTSARHLSLSWANFIQPPQPPSTSCRSILILSSHLSC